MAQSAKNRMAAWRAIPEEHQPAWETFKRWWSALPSEVEQKEINEFWELKSEIKKLFPKRS